jgi:hypothetical protein
MSLARSDKTTQACTGIDRRSAEARQVFRHATAGAIAVLHHGPVRHLGPGIEQRLARLGQFGNAIAGRHQHMSVASWVGPSALPGAAEAALVSTRKILPAPIWENCRELARSCLIL